MRIISIAIVLGLLTACSSMLVGGAGSSGGQLGEDHRTDAQTSADNAITATIRSRFAADTDISRAALGVTTYEGDVTLSGTVASFDMRDRAIGIATRTDGVRNVRNDISVDTNR